jgi:ethylmalonyl-CoA/methylmalonyl-CoA decarboxylase
MERVVSWHPSQLPRGEGKLALEIWDRVAELVIDNVSRRNAISPGTMSDLEQAVERLEAWDGAALVVRGAGTKAFCSGGDLEAVEQHLLDHGDAMARFMTDLLDRLGRLPCVVVAAVEGVALGGGAEILTAADLVVAGERASIGFVHATLGVSPGWGGGRRLVAKVGRSRAMRLLAFAERHDAASAKSLGIVDEVVPDGSAVDRWRTRLAGLPRDALRGAIDIARGSDREREIFVSLWGSPTHRKALGAKGP